MAWLRHWRRQTRPIAPRTNTSDVSPQREGVETSRSLEAGAAKRWSLSKILSREPAANPLPPSRIPSRCARRKSVPGSKFAVFWRIFVPGSNLPLREIPTRFPAIFIPPGEPTLSKMPRGAEADRRQKTIVCPTELPNFHPAWWGFASKADWYCFRVYLTATGTRVRVSSQFRSI